MQIAIELPDNLGQEILQHANMQQFVQRAFEKELLAEKNSTSMEQKLFASLKKTSSVELNEEIVPSITRSLIGLLANSNHNEMDYKQYLEDKYL